MIPDIGLMVGLYIITRMIVVICDKDKTATPKVFSAITILVTLFCIVDLLNKGSSGIPRGF
jgi:hypothetical protein